MNSYSYLLFEFSINVLFLCVALHCILSMILNDHLHYCVCSDTLGEMNFWDESTRLYISFHSLAQN